MRTFGKMARAIQLNRLLFSKSNFKIYLRQKSNSPKTEKPSTTKSKRYSNTLNLPQTSFTLTMKSGAAAKRELEMQKTSGFQSLYQWQYDQNWDKEFILHDGPPYANGKTHVGHVVNKVLKDIMNRYKVLKKYKVHYVPGWDCHGMPIETKAITDKSGRHIELPALDIRTKAKKYAESVLEEQKQSFKRWGVMGDWNNAYRTLAPSYEAKQLEVFYRIYEKGYIYRDYMPVYWSPSSHSALAEAELEYKHDHVSKSIYVKFPMCNIKGLDDTLTDMPLYFPLVYAVVWTTTPWTIPFNKAICYNSKLEYVFLRDVKTKDIYICETSFCEKLQSMVTGALDHVMTFTGDKLEGMSYLSPIGEEELTFLHSDHVTSGKGTGLVHIAPAHGHDDFSIAVEHNLPRDCFVDERGTYTSEVDNNLLRGKTVGVDADDAVISALGSHLLKVEDFTHSYPYDWRTKQPIIIRASKQWFINVKSLRSQALESLSQVKITPQNSENGMIAELNSRPYWCISRQRKWGVPMPIFYNKISGEPLITRETVEHIINLIRKHGSDCWWNLPMEDLLPNHLLEKLGLGNNVDYKKGEDILDIWFDSGVSWAAVLADCGAHQADVYLEGIDQFKGWFQTSLLTSVAVNGKAPYKQLITHGFATDEKGKKMSKSEGNIIDPEEVINGGKDKNSSPSYGADILRWWVAHSHHHQNIMIGPAILQQFQEDVFKLRKCIRHLLGNLYDFKPKTDIVPYSRLTPVDTYMLYVLYTTIKEIETAYEEFSYQRIIQHLEKFFYSDLSAFYITNTKDRCYCDVAEGESRRSSQTVQYFIVKLMSLAFAPIIPHLAEEIYQHMPDCDLQNPDSNSIFKLGWCHPHSEWNNSKAASDLLPVFDMRRSVLDALALESPVDFDIHIYSSPQLHDLLREIQPEVTSTTSSLCEIFQTSQVSVLDCPPLVIPEDSLIVQGSTRLLGDGSSSQEDTEVDYKILVASSLLHICERCRRYTSKSPSTPCDRCLQAVAHDWST